MSESTQQQIDSPVEEKKVEKASTVLLGERLLEIDTPSHTSGLIYPKELVKQVLLKDPGHRYFGYLSMPKRLPHETNEAFLERLIVIDTSAVSHRIDNVRISNDGWLIGDVTFLKTQCGLILEETYDPTKFMFRLAGIANPDQDKRVVHLTIFAFHLTPRAEEAVGATDAVVSHDPIVDDSAEVPSSE